MSWKERFNEAQKKVEVEKKKKKSKVIDEDVYEKFNNLNFGGELREGFKLYLKNIPFLLIIFALSSALMALISMLIFTDFRWNFQQQIYTLYEEFGINFNIWPADAQEIALTLSNNINYFNIAELATSYIPFVLACILASKYLVDQLLNKKPSIKESLLINFKNPQIKSTIFMLLFFSPMIGIGISFFYIPGAIVLMIFGFAFFLNLEGKFGPIQIISASYNHGRDFRLKVLIFAIMGLAFFLFFGNLAVQPFIPLFNTSQYLNWLNPLNRNWGVLYLYQLLQIGTPSLFQPLVLCFIAVFYVEIIVKKNMEFPGEIVETKTEDKELFKI